MRMVAAPFGSARAGATLAAPFGSARAGSILTHTHHGHHLDFHIYLDTWVDENLRQHYLFEAPFYMG